MILGERKNTLECSHHTIVVKRNYDSWAQEIIDKAKNSQKFAVAISCDDRHLNRKGLAYIIAQISLKNSFSHDSQNNYNIYVNTDSDATTDEIVSDIRHLVPETVTKKRYLSIPGSHTDVFFGSIKQSKQLVDLDKAISFDYVFVDDADKLPNEQLCLMIVSFVNAKRMYLAGHSPNYQKKVSWGMLMNSPNAMTFLVSDGVSTPEKSDKLKAVSPKKVQEKRKSPSESVRDRFDKIMSENYSGNFDDMVQPYTVNDFIKSMMDPNNHGYVEIIDANSPEEFMEFLRKFMKGEEL